MARVKGGNIHKNRRVKVLKQAKGFFGSKHKLYKSAKEQVMHSLKYAYRDRRQNKRQMRKLWITRINAACRANEISYSKFIAGLNKAEIAINRKMLSEIAIQDPKMFTEIVKTAKSALEGKKTAPKAVAKAETKTAPKAAPKKEQDFSNLTVAELKKLAKEKNISGYTTMKKAELLSALK